MSNQSYLIYSFNKNSIKEDRKGKEGKENKISFVLRNLTIYLIYITVWLSANISIGSYASDIVNSCVTWIFFFWWKYFCRIDANFRQFVLYAFGNIYALVSWSILCYSNIILKYLFVCSREKKIFISVEKRILLKSRCVFWLISSKSKFWSVILFEFNRKSKYYPRFTSYQVFLCYLCNK